MECKGIEQSYPEHQFLIVSCRFRWVFCQLDALRHCFPPNLRQYLNELPETLDETYERILKGINKAQRDNAHRLLRCLTVAVRPLHVQELAELLAFDFQASTEGGIPTLKEDWRWDDQEEAILSTCSSLITIIPRDDSQVVQFSHFSVKEYLTSSRLATETFHGFVSTWSQHIRSWCRHASQHCSGSTNTLEIATPNCLLWSSTPLNTGWTMPNSRRCRRECGTE